MPGVEPQEKAAGGGGAVADGKRCNWEPEEPQISQNMEVYPLVNVYIAMENHHF